MSLITKVYRSTPLDDVKELYHIYGTSDESQIPFLSKLDGAKRVLHELLHLSRYNDHGVVMAIEGTWGSGKTSFVSLLLKELEHENVACIKFDSLFYGSVSEASEIFIGNLFDEVREVFGVTLKHGNILSDNLSPRLELSNGIPRLNLDFGRKRKSVEVVKEQLSAKLKRLPGKVIVVIDDLDRVASKDIVHFLRIVRVLRELPNFIVILPIDRKAIENLLGNEVEYPSRYLHKLIDHSENINADLDTARKIFNNRIADYAQSGIYIDEGIVENCWDMIIWGIVIDLLDSDVVREAGVVIGSSHTDPSWQNIDRHIASEYGANVVRAVFQRLIPDGYGATDNYVTRVNTRGAVDQPYENISYRNIRSILNQSNLASILMGTAIPALNTGEYIENGQQLVDIMSTRWWRDTVSMINSPHNNNPGSVMQDYSFRVRHDQSGEFNEQMNNEAVYLWDEIYDIARNHFPYNSLPHLAPRSMHKICTNLDFEHIASLGLSYTSRSEDKKYLFEYIRDNVRKTINQS